MADLLTMPLRRVANDLATDTCMRCLSSRLVVLQRQPEHGRDLVVCEWCTMTQGGVLGHLTMFEPVPPPAYDPRTGRVVPW